MASDPYVYQGTDVLINRFDIRDQDKLQEVENFYYWRRVKETLPHGNFDYSHLKTIHKHLFGDVYPWAGEERTVDISKGDSFFARKEFIVNEANKIFSQLAKDNHLSSLDRKSFIEKSAYYFNELNAAHPFREGNGRSLRAFFDVISEQSGYDLDWSKIGKDAYIQASIAGFNGNDKPMTAIFDKIVEPLHTIEKHYQEELTLEKAKQVSAAENKSENNPKNKTETKPIYHDLKNLVSAFQPDEVKLLMHPDWQLVSEMKPSTFVERLKMLDETRNLVIKAAKEDPEKSQRLYKTLINDLKRILYRPYYKELLSEKMPSFGQFVQQHDKNLGFNIRKGKDISM